MTSRMLQTSTLAREDQRVLRRSSTFRGTTRSTSVNEPQFLAVFSEHFPGKKPFFSELTIFLRQSDSLKLSASVRKALNRCIDVIALARVSQIRPAEDCDYCWDQAPFCAVPPAELRPAGMKQHRSARSERCLLHRALGNTSITPRRIKMVFADQEGGLRLCKDTDHRGHELVCLDAYLDTLWNALHLIDAQEMVRTISLVFEEHGLPFKSILRHQQSDQDQLQDRFAELLASVTRQRIASDHRSASDNGVDVARQLAQLHMAIFGADFADLAMHHATVVLNIMCGQVRPGPSALPRPADWLTREAEAVHEQYAPETYLCDNGSSLQVGRNHSQAEVWLEQWSHESEESDMDLPDSRHDSDLEHDSFEGFVREQSDSMRDDHRQSGTRSCSPLDLARGTALSDAEEDLAEYVRFSPPPSEQEWSALDLDEPEMPLQSTGERAPFDQTDSTSAVHLTAERDQASGGKLSHGLLKPLARFLWTHAWLAGLVVTVVLAYTAGKWIGGRQQMNNLREKGRLYAGYTAQPVATRWHG